MRLLQSKPTGPSLVYKVQEKPGYWLGLQLHSERRWWWRNVHTWQSPSTTSQQELPAISSILVQNPVWKMKICKLSSSKLKLFTVLKPVLIIKVNLLTVFELISSSSWMPLYKGLWCLAMPSLNVWKSNVLTLIRSKYLKNVFTFFNFFCVQFL